MTWITDAIGAVAGLLFGGFLFVVFGTALSESMTVTPLIDLRFWGIIYIVTAIGLAGVVVYTAILSIGGNHVRGR
ncbi:hypothetical protein [Halovenus sp. HT40]|uniref:hypothetical protein n=1 Tax=Halovenus sp. HT40 TaxID=3126691 RepID=UPI00300EDF6D